MTASNREITTNKSLTGSRDAQTAHLGDQDWPHGIDPVVCEHVLGLHPRKRRFCSSTQLKTGNMRCWCMRTKDTPPHDDTELSLSNQSSFIA